MHDGFPSCPNFYITLNRSQTFLKDHARCLLETFTFQIADTISLQFLTFGIKRAQEEKIACLHPMEFRNGGNRHKARFFSKDVNEISAMLKMLTKIKLLSR